MPVLMNTREDVPFSSRLSRLKRYFFLDNTETSSSETQALFAMSGDGKDGVKIPLVFLFHTEAKKLLAAVKESKHMRVYMGLQPKTSGLLSSIV